ncbi:unnamed protein product [Rotaria sordida]|uniref:Uncharacterized protein n=1 Tax=Rotaria sordida TaxID=392033 RepID=A0A815F5Y2_9BILA|nr:unnamed protein product [Rotaria sordida]CAF3848453.1 unnamed protein product [Rotaria sordida]
MEFDSKDLSTILMNLFSKHPALIDNNNNNINDNNVCKTEPMEVSSFTEQEKPSTATKMTYIADLKRQQYCLIIFNNPRWSQILNSKSANISKQSDQQQQQRLQTPIDQPIQSLVKHEK